MYVYIGIYYYVCLNVLVYWIGSGSIFFFISRRLGFFFPWFWFRFFVCVHFLCRLEMMSLTPDPHRKVGMGVAPSPPAFYTPRPERRRADSRVFEANWNRQDKDREVNVQVLLRCRWITDFINCKFKMQNLNIWIFVLVRLLEASPEA